jgi:aryl-alcohol dehydrogenase-like predicted oxidoreductase
MQSGLLTERFSVERHSQLPDSDWRRRSPRFQSPNLERGLALRDALRPIAERHGCSVAAIAVAWVLAWPGVTGAIVGARRPEQIDDWLPAATLDLTDGDLTAIADAIAWTEAGSGPATPPR